MEEWLIVDGYNVIGAWPALEKRKEISLQTARDELVERLSEYAAYTGRRVIIVFDAYQVEGRQVTETHPHCTVVYTQKGETADEYIEKLVGSLREKEGRRLFVATSDYVEQRIVFGRGALRMPVRELIQAIEEAKADVSVEAEKLRSNRLPMYSRLNDDIGRQLEKWRRKQ